MLSFYSSSTRMVNTRRGITECIEAALGEQYADCSLMIVHASVGHNFTELVAQAKELAPQATVLAASCCGVVGVEGVSESMKDIALMAIKGDEFAVAHTNNLYGHNAYKKTLAMAQSLYQANPQVSIIYFLASGIDIANDLCIAAIEAVFGAHVTIFGATSSDNMKGVFSYQAVNEEVMEHGAFMVGFADPTLEVDTQATHGFVAFGEPFTVTKANGKQIIELDGKPAWQTFTERLGLPETATCADTIPIGALAEALPPNLAKEYGNGHILRVVTSREGNTMHYATSITEGTQLWLTTRDEEKIFSEMDRMVLDMQARANGRKPVAVFHADCLARGRFLFNRVLKEELVSRMQTPFYNNGTCPPWLGMYGFGEFARLGGINTYHNYTTALYALYRKG